MSISTLAIKYRKTAEMTATSIIGDSPLFLMDYAVRFLRVALLLSLWRILLPHKGLVSGMTLGAVLTYTLIAEVFADQLACRVGLENALWEGNIVVRFLHPLGLVEQFTLEAVGRWAVSWVLFSIPLLLVSPLLGVNPLPASPVAAAVFLVSLTLGVSIGLALEFIMGSLLIWLQLAPWSVSRMREAVAALLSGQVIPLALLPWGLGGVFEWLPFASVASAPLQIYTGTGSIKMLLIKQCIWTLLLWPFALWTWRKNRQRMMSYGG